MASSSDSSSPPHKTLPSFPQNHPTSGEEGKKEGSENIATEPTKVLDSGEGSDGGKTVANKNEREKFVVGEKKRILIPIDSLFIDLRGELPPPRGQHQSNPQEKGGNGNKKVKVEEDSSSHAELQGLDQKGWVLPAKSEFDDKSIPREPKMEVEEAVVEEDKSEVMMPCAEKDIKMEVAHSEEKNKANPSADEEINKEVMVSAAAVVAEVKIALKSGAAAVTAAEVETKLKYEAAATEKVEVEAEPAEAPLIEQQNDDAERIVRDIDLNQLPPEYYEEDN